MYFGYGLKGSRILLEKIDKAEKYNELIELHSHILIDITCLKKIVDFLLWKRNLQFKETSFQFFMIYCTIWILIYEEKTMNFNHCHVREGRSKYNMKDDTQHNSSTQNCSAIYIYLPSRWIKMKTGSYFWWWISFF